MKQPFWPPTGVLVACLALGTCAGPQDGGEREIDLAELHGKIAGGWAGQMIGVSYGGPTEFRHRESIIPEAELPEWYPDMVAGSIRQDDFYVDMTFAQVLDDRDQADFVALMTPGLPQASNDLCDRASRVMNHGDGIYGGMFVSCMYAAAFFESDPRRLVEAGLACLPPESPYAQHPEDWINVWILVEEEWSSREPCPEGAANPFNIDARRNGAYIALGMLYGDGDFGKIMTISTRCGQDSDCNPASALGILGGVLGLEGIPDQYKSGIESIADEKFSYTNYSFRTIVDSTVKRAVAMAERNGGRVEDDRLLVRTRDAVPADLDIWDDYGAPVERIPVTDPRWSWSGDWTDSTSRWRPQHTVRTSASTGAEAAIGFEGTGAIVSGFYLPSGGIADIYLDGQLDRTVDVYPDEDRPKGWEAVWHDYGLEDGSHSLRIVVKGETYPGSTGSDIALTHLVVFR